MAANGYLFSIIIPVYNTEEYLSRCIHSVVDQGFEDYEIILINDGSTDRSESVILRLADQYPHVSIRYFKQENAGLSAARNAGLSAASGEYIIWLDSDDALNADSLSNLAKLTGRKPDLIVNRIASYDEDTEEIRECGYRFDGPLFYRRDQFLGYLKIIKGFWYAAWCFVPRREFLREKQIRFADGLYHEDELWCPQVLCQSDSICCNNSCYYLNTSNRKGSIITTRNIKKEYDKLWVCRQLADWSGSAASLACKRFIRYRILRIMYSVYAATDGYEGDDRRSLSMAYKSALKELYGSAAMFISALYQLRSKIQ